MDLFIDSYSPSEFCQENSCRQLYQVVARKSVPQETALGPDITVVNLFFNLLSLVWSTYIKFDSQFDLQPPVVISKTKVQWV